MVKPGDIIHGFTVDTTQYIEEISANLVQMTYQKTRTPLIWLDREDENMTFAVTFKTIPENDTGVFHILEHSLLCGSEKYPLKDPFVGLLKSSMQTFMNAFTFPDRTMFPACTKNRQDFLNLIDIYMDAVLHPLSLKSKNAFLQEGWHFEIENSEDELKVNGIVYNEMKGAYASYDTILGTELNRLLFPENCYRFESGGDPEHIPELTYETYCKTHEKFYHPSNSRIFLDGSVDIDAVLEKLNVFLSPYDLKPCHFEIPLQAPVSPAEKTAFYQIDEDEENSNLMVLSEGWVVGTYADKEALIAAAILSDTLCDTEDTPLMKALVASGLCEDADLSITDGLLQNTVSITAHNAAPANREKIWQTIHDTLSDLARNGIDHRRLHSVLNHMEFMTREKDFGSQPKGLIFGMNLMETWNYDGDVSQNLRFEDVFNSIRSQIDSGYFERFIQNMLLDNPHHAKLCLLPSKTVANEKELRLKKRLQEFRSKLSQQELFSIISEYQGLQNWQETEDSSEVIATLPKLTTNDLRRSIYHIPEMITRINDVCVLKHPLETNGILYLELYFSLADFPQEQLQILSFFSKLFSDIPTTHYDLATLNSEISYHLGTIDFYTSIITDFNNTDIVTPYFVVNISVLDRKKDEVLRLLPEILQNSDFTCEDLIHRLLHQIRTDFEKEMVSYGNSYATLRAASSLTIPSAISEQMSGLTALKWLQETDALSSADFSKLMDIFRDYQKTIFCSERLTINTTGPADPVFLQHLIDTLPHGKAASPAVYHKFERRNEAVIIPSDVSFAGSVMNLQDAGAAYKGSYGVASQLLSLGYLWNMIRVQGGAYGTNASINYLGDITFSTYRDPSPSDSLTVFNHAGDFLEDFCNSEESLDDFIISTIAAASPLTTPRMDGSRCGRFYLSHISEENRQRNRDAILHASKEDLKVLAEMLKKFESHRICCLVGNKKQIENSAMTFDHIMNYTKITD